MERGEGGWSGAEGGLGADGNAGKGLGLRVEEAELD